MMPILIQGPRQPGNDIDVYLKPLVEELLVLWNKPGVRVWDEYKQEHFDLRAMLFVTINDWPALSNLSGQTNKGYNACTHCFDDLDSIYLKRCRKVVYLGHRRYIGIEDDYFNKAHYTVLQNSSLVHPYIEIHKEFLRSKFPGKTEAWIRRQHMESFSGWLRKECQGDDNIDEQLYLLARQPSWHILTYQGYEINGNTFYTVAQDKRSTNQNSGVRIDGTDPNGNIQTYYGRIEDIWELDYAPNFKVPLFRCQWVKLTGGGVTVDKEYGMTTVDLNNIGYKEEPFVLAADVSQVFYVKDMSTKSKRGKNEDINSMINEPKRHIILSGKINIVGIEDKSDMSEDYERNVRIPPFIVKKDPSIMLNDEDTPWLRQDHNQGSYVKKKFTVVPA